MATTNDPLLRVMVDANVLFAGSVWPRFPYEVLQHAVKGDYRLVLSPFVIAEARKHIAQSFPHALNLFEVLLESSQYEEVPTPTKEEVVANAELVRDPNDVPVALAAIDADVDFLITQDRDFTDRDETTEELHRRLNILLPGTFLRTHMGWTSEELEAIRNRNWGDLE